MAQCEEAVAFPSLTPVTGGSVPGSNLLIKIALVRATHEDTVF